jgi:hypothetical protein
VALTDPPSIESRSRWNECNAKWPRIAFEPVS